jgi:hypothetical protein
MDDRAAHAARRWSRIKDGGLAPSDDLLDPLELGGGTWMCSASPLPRASLFVATAAALLVAALGTTRRRAEA